MGQDDEWKTISTEMHYENRNLRVITEEVTSPARSKPRSWTIVQRKSAVIIAPMTRDGKLLLIRQERIPIRAAIWEVPGGQIDEAVAAGGDSGRILDETNLKAVGLRELREETGYQLAEHGEMIALGDYFSSPGFTDERGYFFLARPVEPAPDGHAHEESESILDCRGFAPPELARMIAENEIRDANTLSICARLVASGFLSLDKIPSQ